jgi:protein-export membrane protein SecD
MNEHDVSHHEVVRAEPIDEQVLAGLRRHLAGVEPLLPVPPAWQPQRVEGSMSESPVPVRVRVGPARTFGLGGLALLGVAAVVAALAFGPLMQRGPAGGGAATASPSASPTSAPSVTTIVYQLVPPSGQEVTAADLQATVTILENRLASAGVSESSVTAVPPDQVKVVIQGAADVAAMRALLGKTGKLEFVLLPPDQYGTLESPGPKAVPSEGAAIDPALPVQFSGDQLDPAGINAGFAADTNAWVVYFAFKEEYATAFETWTGQHVDQYFAIVLDGKIVSAPYIMSAITGGKGQISGDFTESSARQLATVLQHGQLPWPLREVSVETSGPTLVPSAASPSITAAALPTAPQLSSPVAPVVVTPTDIPSSGPALGDPNAPVTLDVWADFRCTACFNFAMTTQPRLIENYVRSGKLRIVHHDFIVIDSYQPGVTESRDAAGAARCAADQGKYWTFADWLYANQSPFEQPGAFTLDRLVEIGRQAGLDMTTFEPCVRNGAHTAEVQAESSAAPSDLTGTPGFYIGGKQVTGSAAGVVPTYEDLAAAVEATLAASPSP